MARRDGCGAAVSTAAWSPLRARKPHDLQLGLRRRSVNTTICAIASRIRAELGRADGYYRDPSLRAVTQVPGTDQ